MAGTYFPHIYFESKAPGRDSVFVAVDDIGVPGMRTKKELVATAISLALDYLDGKTKDHRGRVIRFTKKKWAGRLGILRMHAKRLGGSLILRRIDALRRAYDEGRISKTEFVNELKRIAREVGAIGIINWGRVGKLTKTGVSVRRVKNGIVIKLKKAKRGGKHGKKKKKKGKK